MAGNARFHDKLHRKNHHTLSSYGFPDSAIDPIASHSEPFQGDFVINGSLSTSAGLNFLSADLGGDLYCENLHVRDTTYTNFISGQGTETIISDGALTGYGDYTLTMDYRNAIYAKTPVFNISNTISALGNVYGQKGTFASLSVIGDSNITGSLSVNTNVRVNGNLFIAGNLSALGDMSVIDTNIVSTSALSVINHGTTPALLINQIGNHPTAVFQKDGTDILTISGTNVNIYGTLSATNNIYGNNINSLQNVSGTWDQSYVALTSTSAYWNNAYAILTGGTLSGAISVMGNVSSTGTIYTNSLSVVGNMYSPTINTINTNLSTLSTSISTITTNLSTLSNGFSASLLSGGYQFLPSGLIMQWGFYSNVSVFANSWYTVEFPIRFTTACFTVNTTNHDPISADNHASVLISTPSISSVDVSWSTSNSHAIYWHAIGY